MSTRRVQGTWSKGPGGRVALALLAALLLAAGCGRAPAGPPGKTSLPSPTSAAYPPVQWSPEPTFPPLPTMTPWPTLPTTPTPTPPPHPPKPTWPVTPILPFPTPAFPPAPPGSPPAGLGTIWYPYQAAPDSRPMLTGVLVDDQGRRWGDLGHAIDLGLEPGPFGVDLRGAFSSLDGGSLVVDVGHAEKSSSFWIDPRSGQVSPITTDPRHDSFLSWGPNRKVFVEEYGNSEGEVWLLNLGAQEHQVIQVPSGFGYQSNRAIVLSPDERIIADAAAYGPTVSHLGTEVEIGLQSFPGGNRSIAARISISPSDADPRGFAYVVPHGLMWSPDGTKMALTIVVQGKGELWIVDMATNQARKLTSGLTWYHPAAWSPDGRYIAFIRAQEPSHMQSPADLWLFDLTSSGEIQLTHFAGQRVTSAVWSPDGKRLAFAVTLGDYGEVWITSLDGSEQYPVAGPTAPDAPVVWLPPERGE